MKTQTQFKNASLVSVMNGSVIVKSAAGIEHTFTNASVVSVNNGTIVIESEWKPKKGELVKITGSCIDAYSIFHRYDKSVDTIVVYGYKRINSNSHAFCQCYWYQTSQTEIHPVTTEEQQAFDDFCKSKGKIWNKETLTWEDYKWSPKPNEQYWYVASWGEVTYRQHLDTEYDQSLLQLGNAFPTKEQAEKVRVEMIQFFKSL